MADDTALSVLHSDAHGQERRGQRDIQKIDLLRARRYGMEEMGRNGRIKYTYGGVVFIYDPLCNREVTTFRSPDVALKSSGTKYARPVILPKMVAYENETILQKHDELRILMLNKPDIWTSHSVLVVDMSGSMRRDDVSGAKCRSDGVWMALARDYVMKPLESKTRGHTDLISVVVMKEEAHVVMKFEPINWILYNKIIDLREWKKLRPSGPGNYMPALDTAEKLLLENKGAACALSLMFFSDGRPSDKGDFSSKMGKIAAKFGRRLSFVCIGMAEGGEDFSTLSDMVTEAQSYGAVASFGKPSLDADSLSNIITTLATSLTTSVTEMTNLVTGKARQVRMDITRERIGTPDDHHLTSDWIAYNSNTNYVDTLWSWNYKINQFVNLMDSRCGSCWTETNVFETTKDTIKGYLCHNCRAKSFCSRCLSSGETSFHRKECSDFLRARRLGTLIRPTDYFSWSMAVKKTIFGEGAERIVRKFRYLDKSGNFVGPVMVAKESRYLESDGNYERRMQYHTEFMRTQAIAAEMADKFNHALGEIYTHFQDRNFVKEQINKMPTIEFLKPMVVQAKTDGKEYNILIEPMLEGKYEKFNDNMGMVKGESSKVNIDDLSKSLGNIDLNNKSHGLGGLGGLGGLDAIEEDDEDDDSDEEIFDKKSSSPEHGSYCFSGIKNELFLQAFSHFSYEISKKRFMVVDLQGVFLRKNASSCRYLLTDPVIHKHKKKNKTKYQKWTFGRTDRGEKGMKAFFITHTCNEVCRLLGLEEAHKYVES